MDITTEYRTTINWKTGSIGRTRVLTGSRAGWSFVITGGGRDAFTLTATHTNGRQQVLERPTRQQAKDTALELMHPADAMGWRRWYGDDVERNHGVYTTQWGPDLFRVYDDNGQLFFQHMDAVELQTFPAVPVDGIKQARALAAAILRRIYGEDTGMYRSPAVGKYDVPESVADPKARQKLADALTAAGVSFTPVQLSLAASLLS